MGGREDVRLNERGRSVEEPRDRRLKQIIDKRRKRLRERECERKCLPRLPGSHLRERGRERERERERYIHYSRFHLVLFFSSLNLLVSPESELRRFPFLHLWPRKLGK